jgi:ammonium transporter Rh
MIFIGFGFLMVFLKNHSWCSIGFNYLIAAWVFQITILFRGFWHNVTAYYMDPNHQWTKINITIIELINADFGSGAVLISFGAILGKVNLFQLWTMATIEIWFYAINEAILTTIFQINDIGGSIIIHTFGAYFGLSVSLFYRGEEAKKDKNNLGSGNYLSDLVSMIGTLFLFAYWPSFNAVLGTGSI